MGDSVYGSRDLVAVTPKAGVAFKHGFHTNTRETTRATLGQVPALVNGDYIPGLVLGANSPTPPRVKKPRSVNGKIRFDSSYCDVANIDTARADGWSLVKQGKRRRGGVRSNSKIVYVDMRASDPDTGEPTGPEIKYGWYMRNDLYAAIQTDLTALGVQLSTDNDEDIIFGLRYPKPPSGNYIAIPASGEVTTKRSFIDPKKLDDLPGGWVITDVGNY